MKKKFHIIVPIMSGHNPEVKDDFISFTADAKEIEDYILSRYGKGKTGFVKFIEVTLKISTYVLPIIQLISILWYIGTAHIALRIIGCVINAVGVLTFIMSVLQMKDSWRAGVQREDKTNLVTTGIYSISRNPAFLGFDLMYIGILFAFFNWFLCFATSFVLVFFHLQIVNVEEEFLIDAFGEEYIQYKKKVCRYLGRKL